MLAKLAHDIDSVLRNQQQALSEIYTERPDVQTSEDCLCVLALFDQIKLWHGQRFSANAQCGQGFAPFDTPILRCKSWS